MTLSHQIASRLRFSSVIGKIRPSRSRILLCEIQPRQVLAAEVIVTNQGAVVQTTFQIDSHEDESGVDLPSAEQFQQAVHAADMRPQEALVLLPQSMMRQFKAQVPKMRSDELCTIAQLHAETEIPEQIDQLTLDHDIVGSETDEQLTLRIYGLRNVVLEKIQEVFQITGITCSVVTPEASGWSAAIREQNSSPTIMIVPRENTLEIAAFRDRQLLSQQIRQIPLDADSPDSNQLVGELRRCGMLFSSLFKAEETYTFVLLGTKQKWSALAERVKAEWGTEIAIISPQDLLNWQPSATPDDVDKFKSLAAASALLVQRKTPSINFLAPSKPVNQRQRQIRRLSGIAVAALMMFAMLTTWTNRTKSVLQTRLDDLQKKQNQLETQLEQFSGTEQLEKFLSQRRAQQIDWITTLQTLRSYLPDNEHCYLGNLVCTTEESGRSHLRGQLLAEGPPTILEINQRILEGGQFELQPRGAEPTRKNNRYSIRVTLDATLRSQQQETQSPISSVTVPTSLDQPVDQAPQANSTSPAPSATGDET